VATKVGLLKKEQKFYLEFFGQVGIE